MARPIEITATFLNQRHRFANPCGDVIVGSAVYRSGDKPDSINCDPETHYFSVKGPIETEELNPRGTYRFLGRWTVYTNKRTGDAENQFVFDSFTESEPAEREGVIAYLVRAGEGNGIGPGRALKIWQRYGQDAVRMLRESPEEVAGAIGGLSTEGATAAAQWLQDRQSTEATNIDLTTLFAGRGFPKATAKRAIAKFGNNAARLIRDDPYCLMVLRGCGFKRCDRLYQYLKLPLGALHRQALCAWYSLSVSTKRDGHTWHPAQIAITGIQTSIAGTELKIADAIKLAKSDGMITTLRTDGHRGDFVSQDGFLWLAVARKAVNEQYIAERIAETFGRESHWPSVEDSAILTEHQRDRVTVALAGQICSLGGSPGTGKTFAAAVVIRRIIEQFGAEHIAVAAPTGKAAVRITEALAAYKVDLRAVTIHSLLGVDPMGSDDDGDSDGGFAFKHKASCPLPYRFIIVDESSMIDADLMAAFLRGCARGTHILFVGDVNQLAPVGHGAPLRDLIAGGLPYGELTEIQRNAGAIVQTCAAIRRGETPRIVERAWNEVADHSQNLVIRSAGDSTQQALAMIKAIWDAKNNGFDPVWDVQILAAVNKKSPLSRTNLNKVLQGTLNEQPGDAASPFRVNDKVVNTKNGWYSSVDLPAAVGFGDEPETRERGASSDVYVANGELGRVTEVAEKYFVITLETPRRTIRVPRGKWSADADDDDNSDVPDSDDDNDNNAPQTGCRWDLGYCLSVHKSQGSEWPVVVVMLDEYSGARRVCSREWAYTAFSRAKKRCELIGRQETVNRMVKRVALGDRKTFLAELIQTEWCRRLVEAI